MNAPIRFGLLLAALALATTVQAAGATRPEPVKIVDNVTRCGDMVVPPPAIDIAIDRGTGALFFHSPCGWAFYSVLDIEQIDTAIAQSQAIAVPRAVLNETLRGLAERQRDMARTVSLR